MSKQIVQYNIWIGQWNKMKKKNKISAEWYAHTNSPTVNNANFTESQKTRQFYM